MNRRGRRGFAVKKKSAVPIRVAISQAHCAAVVTVEAGMETVFMSDPSASENATSNIASSMHVPQRNHLEMCEGLLVPKPLTFGG